MTPGTPRPPSTIRRPRLHHQPCSRPGELWLGTLFVVVGLLLPVAAYQDEVGQFGFGTPQARARSRVFARARMFLASPLILAIGVVMLADGQRN